MITVSLAKLDFFCFFQLKAPLEDERRPSYPEKRGSSVIIILIFNPLKIHILHLLDMERKKERPLISQPYYVPPHHPHALCRDHHYSFLVSHIVTKHRIIYGNFLAYFQLLALQLYFNNPLLQIVRILGG